MSDYLVNHGTTAFVSRCHAAPGAAWQRGDRVVLRGRRGVEVGTVLCEAAAAGDADGEVLRAFGAADGAELARQQGLGQRLFAEAGRLAAELGLPLAVLDAEVLFDGSGAVLHAVHWAECDATPLFERLGGQFGLGVTLLDLTGSGRPAAAGCGKPGCGSGGGGCDSCGSGGGGCSTGGCSRGQVKTADELTAYFAGLRQQMEQHQSRVPLA
jgi:hypothetical protein